MQIHHTSDTPHAHDFELMLRVERRRLGVPPAPKTAWAAAWASDAAVPPCAACGSSDDVTADARCAGLPFCHECSSRARSRTEWDDIGCGD